MGSRRHAPWGKQRFDREDEAVAIAVPSWTPPVDMRALAGNRAVAALLDANPTVTAESSRSEVEATRAEAGASGSAVRAPRGSGGTALRPTIRRKLEADTGTDLSGLRIHPGREAGMLADALGAEALTHGGNIFFAGDTGWGDGSWASEAARHGPFRLAILPIGAYLPREIMQSNHMDPDEAVAAGAASLRFSLLSAAAVYWAIMKPELLPASLARKGGRPLTSGLTSRSMRRSLIAAICASAIARLSAA